MNFNEEQFDLKNKCAEFADSAFPVTLELPYQTKPGMHYRSTSKGISKREYFAGVVFSGLVTAQLNDYPDVNVLARTAVQLSDALIEALKGKR